MQDAVQLLADRGFDIAHTFDAHAAAREPGWERLAAGPRLGILIANTRALWPRFLENRLDEPDPLDRYTERTIAAAFPGVEPVFAHQAYDGAFMPFTRLAVAVGLGAQSPGHLVLHPIYGPWIALRAVIAIEGEAPVRAPIPKPCECGEACSAALAKALPSTSWRDWLAVRDACSLCTYRYSEDQVVFHYSTAWGPLTRSYRR